MDPETLQLRALAALGCGTKRLVRAHGARASGVLPAKRQSSNGDMLPPDHGTKAFISLG